MTPNFKLAIIILTLLAIPLLSGCSNTLKVLEGSTHACGTIHLDGYATDSRADVKIVKAPDTWTPEQVEEFCP